MKYYIDRKRVGIAEIFSFMHPIFSASNSMDAEETVRLLCEQKYRTRVKIASGINRAVRKMTGQEGVDLEEYFGDEIRNLAENPIRADNLIELVPLMKWLSGIHRVNSLAADRSAYSLNDAANHMERGAGEFLRSCSSNMMWQNITILQEENGLYMSLQEKFWGKAGLFFPDVQTTFEGTFPLIGTLFCIEAEYTDGGFEFCFVVNVEFGTDDLELRAIQDRNWVRLTFRCGRPEMRLSLFDYGAILRDFGKRGHGFIEDWCSEVIGKEHVLGTPSMSQKEQQLLPLAKILRIAFQMEDVESSDNEHSPSEIAIPEKILELLDNRYRFSSYEKLFEETEQQELYETLKKAVEAWEDEDLDDVSDGLWDFARLLRLKEKEDSIRIFYNRLTEMMLECSSEFDGVSRIYGSYSEAEEKMRAIIEPKLLENGFCGEYPHYRRRRGRKGEYISVLTSNVNSRTVNGVMTYFFSISAAQKRLERRGKRGSAEYFAAGVPFDDTSAEDCALARGRHTKYAELGGAYDDESAEINIDIFEGLSDEKQAEDTAAELLRFVNVALGSFKGRAMPRWYRKKRRKSKLRYDNEITTGGVFMKFLPLGLYVSAVLMGAYVVSDRFFEKNVFREYLFITETRTALVVSLLAGMLVTLFCSLLRMRGLRRHIWRY